MLAAFLHDYVSNKLCSYATCWTTSYDMLDQQVAVSCGGCEVCTSEDFKLLCVPQASYQIFSDIIVRILRALYLGCLFLQVSRYCCDLIGKSNLEVASFSAINSGCFAAALEPSLADVASIYKAIKPSSQSKRDTGEIRENKFEKV